jgi:hypothetical protein
MADAVAAEYLVSHGKSGGFGRFAPVLPLACRRGDVVVVRSQRGLELGSVLCAAGDSHARFLGRTPVGPLLRHATPEDAGAARRLEALGQRVFEDGRRLAGELGVALEVLDVEVLLDGQEAIVQHLSPVHCDPAPIVEALARRHHLHITLENLALPVDLGQTADEPTVGGCGEPNCGKASGSSCASCGTGGGCTSCGSGKVDMSAYFSHLRSKMESQGRRPLV